MGVTLSEAGLRKAIIDALIQQDIARKYEAEAKLDALLRDVGPLMEKIARLDRNIAASRCLLEEA